MKIPKQLEKPGLLLNSQVKKKKKGHDAPIKGMAEYLSKESAFIKTRDWQSFQVGDSTILSFLPSHNLATAFQSEAVVQEIDQENEGVMVEFVQDFKQSDPVNVPEV
jgi:hypothetical protein